jgi:tungstate transport system permease protein
MHSVWESFKNALFLIGNFDTELLGIIVLSLEVSAAALLIASALAIPLGVVTAFKKFYGRGVIVTLLQTFMGLPPVVVGLFLYILLSRSGPLGFMGLLYTPSAMVLAQTILAFPIIAALINAAVVNVDPVIRQASITLGATPFQAATTVVKEARYGIISGMIAGLGRAMAEVGAVLIVGGNIAGYTRVMTTTIAMETDKGNFELALALGIVLLCISFILNLVFHAVQKRGEKKFYQ